MNISPVAKFDQAVRNVACIVEIVSRANRHADPPKCLAFYVVAPQHQRDSGVFEDLVTKGSIRKKVQDRVSQYGDSREAWLRDVFEPTLDRIKVDILTWESILGHIGTVGPQPGLVQFYERCLEFNPMRGQTS